MHINTLSRGLYANKQRAVWDIKPCILQPMQGGQITRKLTTIGSESPKKKLSYKSVIKFG